MIYVKWGVKWTLHFSRKHQKNVEKFCQKVVELKKKIKYNINENA
jgi:hypothetical protein